MRASLVIVFLISTPLLAQIPHDSPLDPCPSSPNCVLETHTFNLSASELSDFVFQALNALSPESIDRGVIDRHMMHAVFKVWGFRDDVNIAIIPGQNESTLHIRSASRKGYSDFGVNRRRVKRILKRLHALMQ